MRTHLAKARTRGGGAVALGGLIAAVALLLVLAGAAGASFNPEASVSLSGKDAGVNADVTTKFGVFAPDLMFKEVITFTPPEWFVAQDADVTDGAVVGELDSLATLGIANTACNTPLNPHFDMHDATTDTSNKFTYDPDTEPIGAANWPGYDVMPSGNERAVDEYPDFLNTLFPGITLRARYFGHAYIPAVTTHVALQFLVFEPGTNLPGLPSFPTEWGYPSVTVLNDPSAPLGPGPLSDNCTTLTSDNTVFGEVDGVPLRTNPSSGKTYTFRSWSIPSPDADNDGIENGLDTCPFTPNVGDIRDNASDDEPSAFYKDGIDSACDPDPNGPCGIGTADDSFIRDCDQDGYENRADNCPLAANGVSGANQTNQADDDSDGIGNECDTTPPGNGPDVVDGPNPAVQCSTQSFGGCEIAMPVEIVGQAVTVTATATTTATATATGTGTPTPTGTATAGTPTPTAVAGQGCSPVIPGTYNGLIRLNGVPAASGYEVTASIGGTPWGSAIVSGGRYAMDIPDHLPTAEPCFEAGTITFSINGATCTPTEQWGSGLHDLDLSCAAVATPTPGTATPTATPATPVKTPTATPAKPPVTGGGGLIGSGDGLPVWAMAMAAWVVVMAMAGLGTLVRARSRKG